MKAIVRALLLFVIAESFADLHAQRSESSVYELMKATKIDEISLHEAPLAAALSVIANKVRQDSGREIRIRYIEPTKIPEVAKPFDLKGFDSTVSIHLNGGSALDALRLAAELGGCRFVFWGDEIVVFSIFVEHDPFRLAVWPLGPTELKDLTDMGVTVFEEGTNTMASVPFEEFLERRAELGLRTSNPFEGMGVKAAPGSFAAVLRGKWTPSYLVVYNTEESVGLVEAMMHSFEYLWWLEEKYFENAAKRFEESKDWDRVERVLKVTELHPGTALTWPAELGQLKRLAKTLEELRANPEAFDIEADAIPPRVKEIQKLMVELAGRYIEALRLYGRVQDLVPEARPKKAEPETDPFGAYEESMFNRVYKKPTPEKTHDEKAGTGQPATCPESKLEGGDKPQPETEKRSR